MQRLKKYIQNKFHKHSVKLQSRLQFAAEEAFDSPDNTLQYIILFVIIAAVCGVGYKYLKK